LPLPRRCLPRRGPRGLRAGRRPPRLRPDHHPAARARRAAADPQRSAGSRHRQPIGWLAVRRLVPVLIVLAACSLLAPTAAQAFELGTLRARGLMRTALLEDPLLGYEAKAGGSIHCNKRLTPLR